MIYSPRNKYWDIFTNFQTCLLKPCILSCRYFTPWPIRRLKISRGVPSLPRSAVSYINVSRKMGGRRVSVWRPAKLNLKVRVYPYTRQSSPRSCREVANHHLATFTTLDSPRLQSFQARLCYRNTRCFFSRAFHLCSLTLSFSLDRDITVPFAKAIPRHSRGLVAYLSETMWSLCDRPREQRPARKLSAGGD